MKIFGSIYPFIEVDGTSIVYGRHVANKDFLIALLTYSTFDEIHLFCLDVKQMQRTKEALACGEFPATKRKAIRFFFLHQIYDALATTNYLVFHLGGWGYFMPGLIYIRNNHAPHLFPITGVIHSLNGLETMYHGIKICTAPLLPFDTIVCSSTAGKAVLEKLFNHINSSFDRQKQSYTGGMATIPLGVGEGCFQTTTKNESRRLLGIAENSCVLMTVGRFSPQTKADLFPLMTTFSRLLRFNHASPLCLVIAGGAAENELRLIHQMIAETGIGHATKVFANFEPKLKIHLYSCADIYVSVSDNLQETFGISVIEAMAAGLPAVVSDIDGYKELVDHGVTGFKVPTCWSSDLEYARLADVSNFSTMQLLLSQCMAVDTILLQEYLQKMIDSPETRNSFGNAGRITAHKKFHWSVVIGLYESLWNRLHEQAQHYDGPVIKTVNPFCLDYLHLFSHYPTSTLSPLHRCSLTADGQQALLVKIIPSSYSDISILFDIETALTLLDFLKKKPAIVDTIIKECPQTYRRDQICLMLLWMAKYGLIQIEAPL
ncbi:MAG: glycosyltransferase family 4 protein [Chitinivibrionales bacterium]|nr:glycosyltransferase family 4 protein [Chitinivibrionales bacterium]